MKYILSNTEPLAKGSEKEIYEHPGSSELLIKIWHSAFLERTEQRHPITTRIHRLTRYRALLNEITEHLVVRDKNAKTHFIQNIVGLIDTDLGTGLVVEAIRQNDGSLAQTLKQMIETLEYKSIHAQALDELLLWLNETDFIIRDFGINNLVWDELNVRFVIVDGIGGRPAISFRRICPPYNRLSNKKRSEKLLKRVSTALQQQEKKLY